MKASVFGEQYGNLRGILCDSKQTGVFGALSETLGEFHEKNELHILEKNCR